MPHPRSSLQHFFGSILSALLIIGCGSGGGSVRPTAGVDHDPLLRRLEAGYASAPDLTVEGSLKISGVPATVWFDAFVRGRDSMKIILTGPFSIPVGAMGATPASFVFFNPDAGEAIDGRPDRETFQKLILVGLDYDEMISLLRGEIPRIPGRGEYTATDVDGKIMYVVEKAGRREEFLVDPDGPEVDSYRRSLVRTDTTTVEIEIQYGAFSDLAGRRFPRTVVVDVAGGAQRIRVAVEKVTPAIDPEESLSITIPGDIPRRRI